MYTEVIFDVETKNLFEDIESDDPSKLGVSIVSAYIRQVTHIFQEVNGEMLSFWEKDIERLFETFKKADRIIGYNSKQFDIQVLAPYTSLNLKSLPHFDILEKIKLSIGKRLRLDSVARETIGVEKIDRGINAVLFWKNGDKESLMKLKEYCERDVQITKDIYDFGLKHGYIRYKDKWNNPASINIDFSYPKITTQKKQIGLF